MLHPPKNCLVNFLSAGIGEGLARFSGKGSDLMVLEGVAGPKILINNDIADSVEKLR
jgi:hypothetical protein